MVQTSAEVILKLVLPIGFRVDRPQFSKLPSFTRWHSDGHAGALAGKHTWWIRSSKYVEVNMFKIHQISRNRGWSNLILNPIDTNGSEVTAAEPFSNAMATTWPMAHEQPS